VYCVRGSASHCSGKPADMFSDNTFLSHCSATWRVLDYSTSSVLYLPLLCASTATPLPPSIRTRPLLPSSSSQLSHVHTIHHSTLSWNCWSFNTCYAPHVLPAPSNPTQPYLIHTCSSHISTCTADYPSACNISHSTDCGHISASSADISCNR